MQHLVVHSTASGPQRLDRLLAASLPEFSRTRLQSLIRQGRVTVGGEEAMRPGQMVEPGSEVNIRVPDPVPSDLTAEDIPLEVVFENEDVVILNKAAGMVVHPAAGHESGTLVNAMLAHDPKMHGIGGEARPGVVHRLDKDTSGLILMAKTDAAMSWMREQFQDRAVQKTYLALVDGAPPSPTGRIDAPIGRAPNNRKLMSVRPEGKGRSAITEYFTEEKLRNHTLLRVHPITGRTHQIRVHLAFLGCPVVGDMVYGRKDPSIEIARHFLHAWKLSVLLPGRTTPEEFSAPLPRDLSQVLEALRAEG